LSLSLLQFDEYSTIAEPHGRRRTGAPHKLLGGKLALTSRLGSGTDAELTIPASLAYLK